MTRLSSTIWLELKGQCINGLFFTRPNVDIVKSIVSIVGVKYLIAVFL